VIVSSPGSLPAHLPDDPFPLFEQWFKSARNERVQPNPDAMVVASATRDAQPSARVVLCRRLIATPGYVVFFTNYASRKGREIEANPRAAAVLHWDALSRQVRLEGRVVRSPAAESDEYFASRPLDSRIGAWASLQSEPLESRTGLLKRVAVMGARYGTHVPRPPHWGGYRLWPDAVELWVEGAFRVHDRARWTRSLEPDGEHAFACGAWQATRLFP
jgi:pyridoxamine 5'-phosphate oxidase